MARCEQRGDDARVDAAARARRRRGRRPTCARTATICSARKSSIFQSGVSFATPEQEVVQQLLPDRRVHDLGMELDEVPRPRRVARRRRARSWRCAPVATKPVGQRGDLVAVAHPRLEAPRQARCQGVGSVDVKVAWPYSRVARLAQRRRPARAARPACRSRCPAAAAFGSSAARIEVVRVGGVPLCGEPERMIAAGVEARDSRRGQVVRAHLAEDARLAHAPRDELRVLRSEVEHEHELPTLQGPLRASLSGGTAGGR